MNHPTEHPKADEYPPAPTEDERTKLRQQHGRVAAGLEIATERLKEHSSSDPATFAAVLRYLDMTGGGHDAAHAEIYARVRVARHANIHNATLACLAVRSEGDDLACGITSLLAGDPEYFGASYDEDVNAFLAAVAKLPPQADTILQRAPEMVDFADVAPERRAFGSMIPGILDRGAFCVGAGQPGAGKTFFFLDLALSQAAGRPWRGQRTSGGATLIVAAEDAAGVHARVDGWKLRHGVETAPVTILDQALDLSTPRGGQALLDYVFRLQCRHYQPAGLVLIDNLGRCLGSADETSGSVMAAVVANIDRVRRETGAAVILVCHPSKTGTGPRGHGALPAAADTMISVAPGLATVIKQRAGEAGVRMPFRIVPVTAPDGRPASAVIEHTQGAAIVTAPAAADVDTNLAALVEAARAASIAGHPLKLHGQDGLYQRRAEMHAPLSGMRRSAIVALGKDAIVAGLLINTAGTLTAAVAH